MVMTEELLHYLWRFRLLQAPLFCVAGEPVVIIQPGEYNRDGGPDFLNARIQVGKTLWAGNVEIHLRASDWFRHRHQEDPAYHNVILHVVDTCDREVIGAGDQPIPVLEVRNNYPVALTTTYETLRSTHRWIPCQHLIAEVDSTIFRLWAPALVVERLQARIKTITTWLAFSENHWDEVGYQVLAGALGSKVNAHPFELLARSAPLRLLLRHRDQLSILEAMLFGQAGILDPSFTEAYPRELLRTYLFYRDKYSLRPLEKGTWKFLRLRPINFPTIRISQLASIIHRKAGFPESLLENLPVSFWMESLQATASSYWDTHFTFDRISTFQVKNLGTKAIHLLLINGIVPLLFLYGTEKNLVFFRERALALLEEISGERNSMISSWEQLGMPVNHALFTQALKQLKSSYCDQKRCLECRIGARLLR
ncbi:MAG: DUF2851 family protein [Bacteroidota bacterium]